MPHDNSAAQALFDSLKRWKQCELLVRNGDSESIYLECKSPAEPRLTKDIKAHLAKAISGFSNTEGGVLVYGAATTPKSHSGLDVITAIEPLGMVDEFANAIRNSSPTLTTPPVFNVTAEVVKRRKSDSSGVVLVHVPKRHGDPVWTLPDETFWFRSGDDFVKAPYEMVKRLFLADLAPDLGLSVHVRPIAGQPNNFHLGFSVINESYAAAQHVQVTVDLDDMKDGTSALVALSGFRDLSQFNRGRKLYGYADNDGVVHKGLGTYIGQIVATGTGPGLKVAVKADVFANRMKPRRYVFNLEVDESISSEGFTVFAEAQSGTPL